jgi:hypothetical protein
MAESRLGVPLDRFTQAAVKKGLIVIDNFGIAVASNERRG